HLPAFIFATHLLQAQVDIETIRTLLGHAKIQTTMIYLHTAKSRTPGSGAFADRWCRGGVSPVLGTLLRQAGSWATHSRAGERRCG
ncbi:MAG: hypothetical protein ACI9TH_004452, partial [Kiritimatiellia bacterium]